MTFPRAMGAPVGAVQNALILSQAARASRGHASGELQVARGVIRASYPASGSSDAQRKPAGTAGEAQAFGQSVLSVVFWVWMWGLIGVFLAVPIAMVTSGVLQHSFPTPEPPSCPEPFRGSERFCIKAHTTCEAMPDSVRATSSMRQACEPHRA
jgi:hypothetical protein